MSPTRDPQHDPRRSDSPSSSCGGGRGVRHGNGIRLRVSALRPESRLTVSLDMASRNFSCFGKQNEEWMLAESDSHRHTDITYSSPVRILGGAVLATHVIYSHTHTPSFESKSSLKPLKNHLFSTSLLVHPGDNFLARSWTHL